MTKPHPRKLLHRAMKAHKMSSAELARRSGASTGTVANWLSGKRGIGPAYAFKLKEILGLEPSDLCPSLPRPPAQVAA